MVYIDKKAEELKDVSDTPRLDIELIICSVLKITKEELFLLKDLSKIDLIDKLIERRKTGEPIAYILKNKDFFGLEFYVNKNVLIPRPETEILCEVCIKYINSNSYTVYDIGTGSGCIAVSIAKGCPNTKIFAIDICDKALSVAKKNTKLHQCEKQIKLIRSDLFSNITPEKDSVIVANLPYIETSYKLPRSVSFEPKKALYGGIDGLFIYKKLLSQISKFQPKAIFLEISDQQADPLIRLNISSPYTIKIYKDLSGHNRIFSLTRN